MLPFRYNKNTEWRISMLSMFLLLTLSSLQWRSCRGFANNLIINSIGCMTELDTTEVIMNNVVKSAEESEFPNMHLAVVSSKENQNPSSVQYYYQPDPGTTTADYQPDPGTTTAELTIAFVNPYSMEEFPEKNDLQFIIQLQDTSDGAPGTSAEFVDGGTIGCDGNQRVSARYKDAEGKVVLQVHDIAASFRLWAGWATGHSAVSLTPELILKPGTIPQEVQDMGSDEQQHTPDDKDKIVDKNQVEITPKPTEKKGPRGVAESNSHEKLQEEEAPGRNKKMEGLQKNARTHRKQVEEKQAPSARKQKLSDNAQKNNGSPEMTKEGGNARQSNPALAEAQRERIIHEEEKRRQELAAEMQRNYPDKHSFRRRYNEGVQVNSTSHIMGSLFFLVSMGGIIVVFGRRREKGHLL